MKVSFRDERRNESFVKSEIFLHFLSSYHHKMTRVTLKLKMYSLGSGPSAILLQLLYAMVQTYFRFFTRFAPSVCMWSLEHVGCSGKTDLMEERHSLPDGFVRRRPPPLAAAVGETNSNSAVFFCLPGIPRGLASPSLAVEG